jgi:lipid-A-disaccharide synthase
MLVTQNGVLVPADSLRKEMEARRRSEHLRARADQALPPTVLAKGLTYEVMAHSDVILTCSGTATLETALFSTPMVILYRGSKLMELEYRLRGLDKKVRFIGLPNILADRAIVPELIQGQATPDAIATHALTLLTDPLRRQEAKADLRAVRECLGEPGASVRTAQMIIELARNGRGNP